MGGVDGGTAYLFSGAPSGTDTASARATATVTGSVSVLAVGDLDGDGVTDLLGGSPGAAWLVYGPIAGTRATAAADALFAATDGDEGVGSSLAVGDVDGDGFLDALVGAWNDGTAGPGAGAVYAFAGGVE